MTLLFIEGFDALAYNDLKGRWDANFASMVTGRFGGQAAQTSSAAGHAHTIGQNVASFVCGFAFKKLTSGGLTAAGIDIVQFRDGSNKQLEIRVNDSWKLVLTRNGTALATSSLSLLVNTWHYIEIKATIADSGGSAIVKVDGVEFINFTGDTKNTANAYITNILLTCGSNGNAVQFDDLYLCDQSGSLNNDLLGDCRIITIRPNGAGAVTEWTPSSGSNYQNVDDAVPNDDTDYNATGTLNATDTFAFEDIVGSGTVRAAALNLVARKDDAATRKIAGVARVGGTNYVGSDIALASSYAFYQDVRETNPATGNPWTLGEINAAEFGYKMTA